MGTMNVSGQTRMQVMDVIDQMTRWYSKKNAGKVLELIDKDFCSIGSKPDEIVRGKEEFRSYLENKFGQCDALTIEFAGMKISAEGTIAWFVSDCTITETIGGVAHVVSGQITGVLRGIGHTWLFAQTHFSVVESRQQTLG